MNKHTPDSKTSLSWAHPLVQEWFLSKFGSPTEPQEQGWPSILAGNSTLISAPTGSGKTFTAFLACLDQLVRQALSGHLEDKTEVLYVSPLKALGNDIQKNLMEPLSEILALAEAQQLKMKEIRVAVRTGDTLARERQSMLKKPPHILVTTPESLYILLTAEKSRVILKDIKTIIVDEIHALVNNKRGSHLALSLERLEALTLSTPLRIGLSATQKPLEIVAKFLGGARPLPHIINIGHTKHLDLKIEVPSSELGPVASNEMWDEIYDRVAEFAQQNRSTLIFVNTRRLAERVAHHLAERLGEEKVAAHHGSLSRKLRLDAETKLKNGELTALVATASLELGIDIGTIDLVCQIGSPRAIAVALQRVGRAGHWRGAISKGRIFVTTRDELVECAALVDAIRQGELDQLIIPKEPLDILSQQIVALCATGEFEEEKLFLLVKKAYPYNHLSRENFNAILKMLSDGIAGSRGRYGAYLYHDQINHRVKARRNARLTAITSGGAIPDNGLFTVIAEPEGVMVGTLDEDFAVESNRGDIILLGSTSWQVKRVEGALGRVLVEDAQGASPSVPFWRGEAPARTQELSQRFSKLREEVSEGLSLNDIKEKCGLDNAGAEQLRDYVLEGKKVLGAVPTQTTVIAERFFDEAGGMQLIIHAPFGARINKAWGLALRKKFCRYFNFELQAAATDNGLNISLGEQHSFPLGDVFNFLHTNTIQEVLTQAVLQSPLFATRWRWDAGRALALIRFRNGKKTPPNIMRMLSDDLLAAVFPDAAACQDNLGGRDIALPDHPLINEAMKDALTEALDLEGLTEVLTGIQNGNIQCIAVDTPTPSVFSHEILNANPYAYLDDAPLEERRARAVEMRRVLPASVLEEVGKLDLNAIHEVQEQAWPDVRNADELHDSLQTLIACPADLAKNWEPYLADLIHNNRVIIKNYKNKTFWIASEKIKIFSSIYLDAESPTKDEDFLTMLKGWMLHLGPTTTDELASKLSLNPAEVNQYLIRLETTGMILRGHFRTTDKDITEWCERRLLARIHRLTLGVLRKQIAPVTAAEFMRWLLRWQHLTPDTQLKGEQGLLEIIKQLQGFELPANAWERQIFAKRVSDYHKDLLDHLCLSGRVGWGRFSLRAETNKQVTPTSIAPITFYLREESKLYKQESSPVLSHIAKEVLAYLTAKGASFFTDIAKNVNHLKAEIESALWELVAAGVITSDGFDNLRALIDANRRLGKRGHRKPRYSSGRWALLSIDEPSPSAEDLCWVLLKRYGIVFRDLIAREKNLPRWRELLIAFRKLEDKGEIRGGRFVSGFIGEQFALPYAVDSLRSIKKLELDKEKITLAASDPLNLIGIILPGAKISSTSGNKITLTDGIYENIP